jgi:hypothetical protein
MPQIYAHKDISFRFVTLLKTLGMHIKKQLLEFLSRIPARHLAAITLLILAACANPVAPTGGPRDTDPPIILRSDPENGSVNFDAGEIRLTFDEFVQVRGLSQQFLSSPPFQKVPQTRLRGKTLSIQLDEELRDNTTYTLFFGNAIADFNEGNSIPNYRFIFSTGPVLDSMELKGRVINAKTMDPEKEVFVMLYDDYRDSIPLLERPYYISRTNDKGDFTFTNLRNMPYKIFALRDVNANLIYDQPNEEIAFMSELVHPVAPAKPRKTDTSPAIDTLMPEGTHIHENDTIIFQTEDNGHDHEHFELVNEDGEELDITDPETQMVNDTIELISDSIAMLRDSIALEEQFKALTLFLFTEVDSVQRLERSEYLHPSRLRFVFRFPVQELVINPIPPFDEAWKLPEMSSKSDTLIYWLLDIERDSLFLEVSASKMKTDTLKLSLTDMHTYRKEKKSDTTHTWLDIKTNFPRSGSFDIHEPVKLSFSEPIDSINAERIVLLEDSVRIEPEIKFLDELQRSLIINHAWKDTTSYDLLIPDSVFIGIYGNYNDTLQKQFRTRMLSDYGNLKLKIDHSFEEGQLIVELLDDKGKTLKRKITGLEKEVIDFPFLIPGKYKVQLTHDQNANGKWDTGFYLEGIQPEKVYMFGKELELRANWDLEETFTVSKE